MVTPWDLRCGSAGHPSLIGRSLTASILFADAETKRPAEL